MEISKLKHIHFTGIKGVGMTALAIYAKQMGIKVTGSDVKELFVTDEVLVKNEISWSLGFGVQNLTPKPDLVVTTAAHGGLNNAEVIAAKESGLKVLTYAEALAEFAQGKDLITVCGVGGKTTTSSMIATVLDYASKRPSYVVGVGSIFPIGSPAKYDKDGKYFVCEADEYVISPGVNNDPKFSLLKPKVVVVTNIEHDHPDIYPTIEDILKTFKEFFSKISKKGLLVACIDNPNVKKSLRGLNVPIATYGFDKQADWQVKNLTFINQSTRFSIYSRKDKMLVVELSLNVPGEFNALNACAAFVTGKFLGLDNGAIKSGLEAFLGTRRRFEKMGNYQEAVFYDDYAHHPSEIESVIKATKDWFPKRRIVTLFQPHTYSRTKVLFKEFSRSFKDSDVVGLMDIYSSARESKDETVSSKLLAKETKKHNSKTFYLGDQKNTLTWIRKNVKKGDIVLTLGAGDIFHIYQKLNVRIEN